MERFNQRVQAGLFSPERLAPEEPLESLTPPGAFPQYFISNRMPLAPAHWALKVGGLVQRPMVLSLEELTRLPRTDYRIRHHCVEGWSAVAAWHGVRVSELAKLVGVDPRATFVEFRSFDSDYFSSWDGPSAFHPQTILAYGMNGQPLLPEYGAPLRLYSGVKLGYKMVKYLTEVNFLPEPTGGTWEDRGYEWYAGV
jgi:DMSO/TMAO reductase YedYZ molybdopterin-dependent catalytic subunit